MSFRPMRLELVFLAAALAVSSASPAAAQRNRVPPTKIEVMPRPVNGIDPIAEFATGVVALNAKQYEVARNALERAIKVAPEHYDAWGFLGAARAGLGDWEGSKAAYEQMIRIEPNSSHGHAGLALALAVLKDNAKVEAELQWLGERLKMCVGKCTDRMLLQTMIPQIRSVMDGTAAPKPMAKLQDHSRSERADT